MLRAQCCHTFTHCLLFFPKSHALFHCCGLVLSYCNREYGPIYVSACYQLAEISFSGVPYPSKTVRAFQLDFSLLADKNRDSAQTINQPFIRLWLLFPVCSRWLPRCSVPTSQGAAVDCFGHIYWRMTSLPGEEGGSQWLRLSHASTRPLATRAVNKLLFLTGNPQQVERKHGKGSQ